MKPRLPSWKGRHTSSDGPSMIMTPTWAKAAAPSGVIDMSEVSTSTSSTMPASIHILAVSIAAIPDAHMAVTDMVGPWKSNSRLMAVSAVEGMSWRIWRLEVWKPLRW